MKTGNLGFPLKFRKVHQTLRFKSAKIIIFQWNPLEEITLWVDSLMTAWSMASRLFAYQARPSDIDKAKDSSLSDPLESIKLENFQPLHKI